VFLHGKGEYCPVWAYPYWDGIYFWQQEFICLYLLPLYIIFNAKFVDKDLLEETVRTRSYAIGSGSHTEQGNGKFQGT
jgi:hypothetical protein